MSKKLEPSVVLEPIQKVLDAITSESFPPDSMSFLDLAEQIKPLLAFDLGIIDSCKGAAATRMKVLSMRDEAIYILCAVARNEAAQAA